MKGRITTWWQRFNEHQNLSRWLNEGKLQWSLIIMLSTNPNCLKPHIIKLVMTILAFTASLIFLIAWHNNPPMSSNALAVWSLDEEPGSSAWHAMVRRDPAVLSLSSLTRALEVHWTWRALPCPSGRMANPDGRRKIEVWSPPFMTLRILSSSTGA